MTLKVPSFTPIHPQCTTYSIFIHRYMYLRLHTFRTRGNSTCRLHRPSLDINIRRQPTGPRLTSYVSSGDKTSSQQIDWQQGLGITRLRSAGYCFSTMSTHFPHRARGPGMVTMSTVVNSCTCSASPATSGSLEEQFQSRSKSLCAFGGLLLKISLLRRLLEDPVLLDNAGLLIQKASRARFERGVSVSSELTEKERRCLGLAIGLGLY